MKLSVSKIVLPVAFLLCFAWTGVAHSAPSLYYVLQDVELGGKTQKVLVPMVTDFGAGSPVQIVQSAFKQLKMLDPGTYSSVSLSVDPNFFSNGRVSVETGSLSGEALGRVLGELYYTLSPLGMKTFSAPSVRSTPIGPSAIPFVVATLTVPAWQAVPPANYVGALVRISDSEVISADAFYAKIASRDATLANSIAEGLKSSDATVRLTVAKGLQGLAVSDAAAKLLPLLNDTSQDVRLAAIEAMSPHGKDAAVQKALENVVMNDSDSAAKAAAVTVLVSAGRNEFQTFLYIAKLSDSNPMVVMDAIGKLAAAKNPAAASSLVDVLVHNSPDVRSAAFQGLVQGQFSDSLSRGLKMKGVSDDMRLRIAKAMTGLPQDDKINEGLAYILVAGELSSAQKAAQALGERKAKEGVDALIESLNHFDENIRHLSARSLGQVGDPKAVSSLAKMAKGGREKDRAVGAEAAVALLSSLSLDKVIEFSNNESAEVRRLSVRSLGAFSQGGRNQKVLQVLQARMMDSDKKIRQSAAVALAGIEDQDIARSFLALKGDSDAVVRSCVAMTLGWSNNPQAGDLLIEMLKDSNSEVKRRAADAIARRIEKRALDELLKYKTYGKAEVRSAIIGAIVAITSAAENERLKPLFQNALYDQDERVKLYAVEGMARHLGTPTALSAITALGGVVIDPSPAVQKAVVEKLGTSKDATATEHLARALFSEHAEVKMAALDAMQANGQENAAKPIQEFIMNETDAALRQKANDVYDSLP